MLAAMLQRKLTARLRVKVEQPAIWQCAGSAGEPACMSSDVTSWKYVQERQGPRRQMMLCRLSTLHCQSAQVSDLRPQRSQLKFSKLVALQLREVKWIEIRV